MIQLPARKLAYPCSHTQTTLEGKTPGSQRQNCKQIWKEKYEVFQHKNKSSCMVTTPAFKCISAGGQKGMDPYEENKTDTKY